MYMRAIVVAGLVLGHLAVGASAWADVRLPHVFSSHMVLQRDKDIPIWGWAEPGEKVTVVAPGTSYTVTTNDEGKWHFRMDPLPVGGPYTITVRGSNEVVLDDVLVGEVWVCSGQSNMEWPVNRSDKPDEEIAAAKHPNIRLFHVPKVPAGTPQDDVDATWQVCSPETIPNFSAVAYFFGRKLNEDLNVPVGVIETAWGGTRIEPWTPLSGFRSVPELVPIAEESEAASAQYARDTAALAADAKPPEHPLANQGKPTGLYNGMVHPLLPYAIRGAIWYQGESNRDDGSDYFGKMKALIAGWRGVWKQGDFPFIFVQLAPFKYGGDRPDLLPLIWEAQAKALTIPNTGMAVTTDIGNVADIHPTNKQEVGRRLALWALSHTYGKSDVPYSGPVYTGMSVEGNTVRLRFSHVGSELKSRDGQPIKGFEIAGEDGNYVAAEAKIDGQTVVVSAANVEKPVSVRFAWHQEAEPNLMNSDGLPALPFRTRR